MLYSLNLSELYINYTSVKTGKKKKKEYSWHRADVSCPSSIIFGQFELTCRPCHSSPIKNHRKSDFTYQKALVL